MLDEKIETKIRQLASTPEFYKKPYFYIHELSKIEQQLNKLEKVLPSFCELYYAMKANPDERILQAMRQHQLIAGIEIASIGEMNKASQYFSAKDIIFTGPGKTNWELEQVLTNGIQQIHIESLNEALRLNHFITQKKHPKLPVLIRINLDYQLQGAHNQAAGISSKFGIDEKEIITTTQKILSLSGLDVHGFHVFAGSGVTNAEYFNDYLDYVSQLMSKLKSHNLPIKTIDIGGGFGIDYSGAGNELDIDSIGNCIHQLKSTLGDEVERFILELGRYLVGESGHYISEIVDIKTSYGKKHIITAGGINHQRRPMAQQQNHPLSILPMNKKPLSADADKIKNETVDIGGPLCTKVDYLAKDQWVNQATIGDLVVLHCSGAYGQSVGHVNFLTHPLADEYFI